MKRVSGRRVLTFDEFFERERRGRTGPEKTGRSEARARAGGRRGGKPPRGQGPRGDERRNRVSPSHGRLFRTALLLAAAAALLGLTFTEDFVSVSRQTVQSFSVAGLFGKSGKTAGAQTQLTLNKRPAFPGCRSNLAARKSTQKIAQSVCPSVVGIVQYRKGSIRETAEGSGIIMSSDGYIITNNHVVENASRLVVALPDKKKLEASLVGRDTRMDLAVVKVDLSGLPAATFGDSTQCEVGEPVIAIGNPSGLQLAGSVTQGIISALNRNVDVGNGPMNLIQTDAAINPGNSGGALVNLYGQVVGINSAKIAQQGYEGIGFSIPITTAKPIIDSLIRYGYVKGRVKLGFYCRVLDEITARLNGLPAGIYIEAVEKGGPAEKAGLKTGDIVTKVDGAAADGTETLIVRRDRHKPGERMQFELYRDGQKLNVSVVLEEDRGDRPVSAKGYGW